MMSAIEVIVASSKNRCGSCRGGGKKLCTYARADEEGSIRTSSCSSYYSS